MKTKKNLLILALTIIVLIAISFFIGRKTKNIFCFDYNYESPLHQNYYLNLDAILYSTDSAISQLDSVWVKNFRIDSLRENVVKYRNRWVQELLPVKEVNSMSFIIIESLAVEYDIEDEYASSGYFYRNLLICFGSDSLPTLYAYSIPYFGETEISKVENLQIIDSTIFEINKYLEINLHQDNEEVKSMMKSVPFVIITLYSDEIGFETKVYPLLGSLVSTYDSINEDYRALHYKYLSDIEILLGRYPLRTIFIEGKCRGKNSLSKSVR
jgi:hypothetical protein